MQTNNQNTIDSKDVKKIKSSTKKRRQVQSAVVNIYASFNNTIISISEPNGNVLCWASAGAEGFKGSRKSTPYAAQVAAQKAMSIAIEQGLVSVTIKVRGPGVGRESALRAIQATGINVYSISDCTYLPHNGCRPSKKRRV